MIDFVHLTLTRKIPEDGFDWMVWKEKEWENGGLAYEYHCRSVVIRYYPRKWLLTIKGKIIQLLHDSQVQNVDDIYGNETEVFIAGINQKLDLILPRMGVDLRDFEVKRIDYCFNIRTAYVSEYLDQLNKAFKNLEHKGRVNHSRLHGLQGSIYVKTLGDYKGNTLRNYVLNYYDKANQLLNQQKKKVRVTGEDLAWAQDILRLEAQCGFQFIKGLCLKLDINRSFGALFSYRAAYRAHQEIYGRIFSANAEQDFYTYTAAKRLLISRDEKAAQTLLAAARGQNIMTQNFLCGRKQLGARGIFPYALLPKGSLVEALENPLKLIERKLETLGVDCNSD